MNNNRRLLSLINNISGRLLPAALMILCVLLLALCRPATLYAADMEGEETSEETIPEETTPGEIIPEEVTQEESTPEEIIPEEITPEEIIVVEVIPEEIMSEEVIPEETTPEEVIPEEITPEEIIVEEVTPEEITPEEVIPEETTPEEVIPEETTPEEVFPEEIKPEEEIPEETTPEEEIPEETMPEEVIPEETISEEAVPEVSVVEQAVVVFEEAEIEISRETADAGKGYTGWKTQNGKKYWYENGIKQGTTGRGKEIYDPGSDAWYWLDAVQGGAMAAGKDVYMESAAGKFADRSDGTGKWVRYDSNGHMVKGWDTVNGKSYYFDTIYGSMAKGKTDINRLPCWFDTATGIGVDKKWENVGGEDLYWYEKGKRQGYNPNDSSYRGKEIYDPGSNAWYWLDNNAKGKRAADKDVYQPYTIYGQDNDGKWVRYDEDGHMVKGWDYQNGAYYFDLKTGAMTKGEKTIDNEQFTFNSNGVLVSEHTPKSFLGTIKKMVTEDMEENDILASLTAAQAYLESGYGNSLLTEVANNLFGIKGTYNGNKVTLNTQEYYNGRYITAKANFRKYENWSQSVDDHSRLLTSASRYANLVGLKDYRKACIYIREDGYATDPLYTLKLINLIKVWNLNDWDGDEGTDSYSSSDLEVVTTANLNIRSTWSTSGSIISTIPQGTIVVVSETNGNWGRLADYPDGWICLDYVRDR